GIAPASPQPARDCVPGADRWFPASRSAGQCHLGRQERQKGSPGHSVPCCRQSSRFPQPECPSNGCPPHSVRRNSLVGRSRRRQNRRSKLLSVPVVLFFLYIYVCYIVLTIFKAHLLFHLHY